MLGGSWIFKELLVPAFEKKIQNQRTIDSKYFKKTLKELLGLSVLCWFFNFFFFPGQSQGQVFEILTSTGYVPHLTSVRGLVQNQRTAQQR